MEHLQPDILEIVFDKVPEFNLWVVFGRVCKAWRQMAKERRDLRRLAMGSSTQPERIPPLPLWYFKELWDNSEGFRYRYDIAECAAVRGEIGALQHVHDGGEYGRECLHHMRVCCILAAHGHLVALQWAHTNGYLSLQDTGPSLAAAQHGHVPVLEWLLKLGCSLDLLVCGAAALNGHLPVLQWAHANGCPWSACTLRNAARGGHLPLLQWAQAKGCPWDEETCMEAAFFGHLEVLQWARAHGCPWNADTCESAAEMGHLAVLQWAHASGCPCDLRRCKELAGAAHADVARWCDQMGG